jgi:hypothetical protein
MILIDTLSCNDKREAEKKKRQYVEELHATLNKHTPYRSEEEVREYKHQWHYANRERLINEREANYIENKDEILNENKAHYEDNSATCQTWRNCNTLCSCGFTCTNANKARHVTT